MKRLAVLALLLAPTAVTAQSRMVSAAGMPLNDGALAPGMLTVRVVEGGFDRNLADIDVDLEVANGRQRARTGSDGRAQFAHLPIGADVRASVVVDGSRLESERFAMPAESGVRLLFVAGDGDAIASRPAPAGPATALPGVPATADHAPSAATSRATSDDDGVRMVRIGVIALTILAFAIVAFQRIRA